MADDGLNYEERKAERLVASGVPPKRIRDLPSNSHKSRELAVAEEKTTKATKVVRGSVRQKKKSLGKKMTELFSGEDPSGVWRYIIYDVLLPAAKKTLSEMINGGTDMFLFGDPQGKRSYRDRDTSYTPYNRYHDKDRPNRERDNRSRASMTFDDIVLESRGEAEEVLNLLVDRVDEFDMATVADLYDLVGITSKFTDNKYGWTNLSSASVTRVRDGYLLNLPRARVLPE